MALLFFTVAWIELRTPRRNGGDSKSMFELIINAVMIHRNINMYYMIRTTDSKTHTMCVKCGRIIHDKHISRHMKTHRFKIPFKFWCETVPSSMIRDDFFEKNELRLRDPSLLYTRILSLMSR